MGAVFDFFKGSSGGRVIMVPGITGSVLRYPGPEILANTVWCNPARLVRGGFSDMRLAIPSESDPGPRVPVTEAGGPLPFYYGPFAAWLTGKGWTVRWPVGDWRRPMIEDAAGLVALIRAEAAAGPVKIVCHSRGGLVARWALAALDAANQRAMVSRVIGLGVPHTGSLIAAQYVSGDAQSTRLVDSLARIFPGNLPHAYLVSEVTAVTRSWPALYELMPRPACPWLPSEISNALYLKATWQPSATVPVESHLLSAASNWANMPPVPSWVEWIDVAGVNVPTPKSVTSLSDLALAGEVNFDGDGDGVAPLESAAESPRKRVTVPSGHSSLIIDPRVWEVVQELLVNGTQTGFTLTGRVLNL